jgi:hypothetical protein
VIDDQEEALAWALGALVQDPAPPCAVDIGAVVAAGRRSRRRRRTFVAATLAVLLAVGAAALTLPSRRVQQPDTHSRHAVLDPHDPLRVDAQFGWLPPSMRSVSTGSSLEPKVANPRQVWATSADLLTDTTGPRLVLYAFPKGVDPQVTPADDPYVTGQNAGLAPEVNGRQAYWRSSLPKRPAALELRWLSPDGTWVELVSFGAPEISKSDLLHVASDVTVESTSLPMPFFVTHSTGIRVMNASEQVSLRGQHALAGPVFTLSLAFGSEYVYYFTVSAHTGAPPIAVPVQSALAERNSRSSQLCSTQRGLDICVKTLGPEPAAGLRAALDHIQPVGPDHKSWTTDVLR